MMRKYRHAHNKSYQTINIDEKLEKKNKELYHCLDCTLSALNEDNSEIVNDDRIKNKNVLASEISSFMKDLFAENRAIRFLLTDKDSLPTSTRDFSDFSLLGLLHSSVSMLDNYSANRALIQKNAKKAFELAVDLQDYEIALTLNRKQETQSDGMDK